AALDCHTWLGTARRYGLRRFRRGAATVALIVVSVADDPRLGCDGGRAPDVNARTAVARCADRSVGCVRHSSALEPGGQSNQAVHCNKPPPLPRSHAGAPCALTVLVIAERFDWQRQ